MKVKSLFAIVVLCFVFFNCGAGENYFSKLPKEADPVIIGKLLTNRFLEQEHSQYGSPLRVNEPRKQITYPDVCTWLGGLWFAKETGNKELSRRLEARFEPLFSVESYLQPNPNHVDNNVFGALVLELYKQTGEEKYKTLGLMYADTQWKLPVDSVNNPVLKALEDEGYSWQTRIWLDDMFMITAVQGQAYRITKDLNYVNRAAKEMVLYLDSIHEPNGLFYHSPTAPFCWGRGNGWLAVGMAELLRVLPENNPDRPKIMEGYLKMMESLKKYQTESGMWRQLIDDSEMWEETSGTAMFTYSMIVGVRKKWLDANEFGPRARKAWIALSSYIEKNGDIKGVCEGTGIGKSREYYFKRKQLTGDLHGQAPVLWCCYALIAENL